MIILLKKKEDDLETFYRDVTDWKPENLTQQRIEAYWKRLSKYCQKNSLILTQGTSILLI